MGQPSRYNGRSFGRTARREFGPRGPVSYTHLDVYKRQAVRGHGAAYANEVPMLSLIHI
ncbi:hypothetical protein [Burkholderia plantarii]|uniref:hypothetical protein n=1 Tax=Burkholderia plantarii TaxID=41899 RepID=UPI00149550B2|nr:hypothetical protein [Burkholderia plantarii]